MASVRSIGYLVIDATDLDAWEKFGSEVCGMQLTVKTADRLEFRIDEKEYRFIINKADTDKTRVIGWEVGGPKDLEEIIARVEGGGYTVTRHSREEARERRVTQLASFVDPDGMTLELHYGLREAMSRFVSPTGATFTTRARNGEPMGFGHVLQAVSDIPKYEELYFNLLGFRLSDHIERGDADLHFTHCNPRQHSFAFAQREPAGVGHFMLEVDDLDMVGRAYDKVLEHKMAPLLSTLGKHTNDKMTSFYMRNPSGFGVEYGTGGLQIDDAVWVPTRYKDAHYWGHLPAAKLAETDPANH